MDHMEDYLRQLSELIDLSQNRPLNDLVYEGLRKAIIKGVIPVGVRLNEKVYAEYLNISRTPIRKAITRLHDEGLLQYVPNYGMIINRVSSEDAAEIYKIRQALDTLASIEAMNNMTEADFDAMEALLKKTEMLEEAGQVDQVISLFTDFNAMIYRNAKMPRLQIMIQRLRDYLARFRDISLHDDIRRKRALAEHKIIFRCLKNKNEEQLRMVITEHLGYYNENIVLKLIEEEHHANKEDL